MRTMIALLVTAVAAMSASTIVPPPAGINASGIIVFQKNIGDFDGDHCEDVLLFWQDHNPVTFKYTNLFGIYSAKKRAYLVTDSCDPSDRNVLSGNMRNVNFNDMIYRGKLYTADTGVSGTIVANFSRLIPNRLRYKTQILHLGEIMHGSKLTLFSANGTVILRQVVNNTVIRLKCPKGVYIAVLDNISYRVVQRIDIADGQ